ncbi:hypothetical protein FE257_004502 [Aspergillus nanangensis]|uniref:Ent-kaurene synthase n=1 Tax=Aspergillus nanangensis TaxID=2582783 RepID=A0AAD4GZE6_ASPNN|nr:hypothetical protein FE257_004502 [Aspergillus nanangensis]
MTMHNEWQDETQRAQKQSEAGCNPQQEAIALLEYLAQDHHPEHGFGAVSSSVYDTAWVSMIEKAGADGEKFWLFKECYDFLLNAQCEDGGWAANAVLFDRTAHTLAGLLAVKKHLDREEDPQNCQNWRERISKAIEFLNQALPHLPAAAVTELTIGAELWLPKMLELLEKEDIHLDSASVLLWILPCRDKKLSRFPIETLYQPVVTSVSHSLEALIGYADLNRVSQLKSCGSMMGSPSSTAAYLIHSSTWDDDAEAYLHRAIHSSSACRDGGVPSTYPTTVFERAWIPVNFLMSGVSFDKETQSLLQNIGVKLQTVLEVQNGITGFAPGMCMDADDTAKTLTLLNLLGLPASPDALIDRFEACDYFLTFGLERNPSVSTNAHVLIALLHTQNPNRYIPQIEKCVQHLCRVWGASDCFVEDKWNISPYYPVMLICDGLLKYLRQWENEALTTTLNPQVPLVLHQALTRILLNQNPDGSWGPRSSLEETSYAVLTVKRLLSLPFSPQLRDTSVQAVLNTESYLREQYSLGYVPTRERLWVDKTLYSIETVSKSYIISALSAPTLDTQASERLKALFNAPESIITKQARFLHSLPSFSQTPKWVVEASVREGYMLIDELRNVDFFSQRAKLSDKYLIYCSSCFVASNTSGRYFLGTDYLMMVLRITVATYQLDTFMDHEVMAFSTIELGELESFIQKALRPSYSLPYTSEGAKNSSKCEDNDNSHGRIESSKAHLQAFIEFMLADPDNTVSDYDRMNLRNELKAALLAQVTHIRGSKQLDQGNKDGIHEWARETTFFSWLRSCASDNVLYPVILKYMICHMGAGADQRGKDVFHTPEEKYIVEDFCRHAAAEVRLWNDYGSAERDRAEGVLNSVDLLGLSPAINGGVDATCAKNYKIAALEKMARYENKHVRLCLEQLEHAMKKADVPRGARLMSRLRMHERVAQVWAEMYSLFKFSATGVQS